MQLEYKPEIISIEIFLIEDLLAIVDSWLDYFPSDDSDKNEESGEARYIIKLINRRIKDNEAKNLKTKEVS